jgi:hypothetical protein
MIEVLKQALANAKLNERHQTIAESYYWLRQYKLLAEQAIAELESQEPVAWMLTDKNINSIQVDSIQRLIDRQKHAHHTDLCARINGQDEWFEADWLKHMVRVTPPAQTQRTWVGLTDEEIIDVIHPLVMAEMPDQATDYEIAKAIEAKLKELNT